MWRHYDVISVQKSEYLVKVTPKLFYVKMFQISWHVDTSSKIRRKTQKKCIKNHFDIIMTSFTQIFARNYLKLTNF